MTNIAGSVTAEASLDISKFKAAAADMGSEGEKIISAMERTASGIQRAQGNLEAYSLSLEAAEARMTAASGAVEMAAADLNDLGSALEEARKKTDVLEKAYDDAVKRFGEGSLVAKTALDDLNEAIDAQLDLEKQFAKQQIVVDKNAAAFKQAASAVQGYKNKISSTEGKIQDLTDEVKDLSDALIAKPVEGFTEATVEAEDSTVELSDTLGKLLTKSANSASAKIGTLATRMLGLDTSTATGTLAAKGLTTGLRELISASGAMGLAVAGATAVVGYGLYKWYDYASGAKAAREAMQELTEAAKEWNETNVTTSFEKSEGLNAFGLSAENFRVPSIDSDATKDWVEQTIATWTDGEKETDAILKSVVEGFTSASDNMRTGLESVQRTAKELGADGSGIFGDIDADIARLNAMDKEVEKLLTKRQNGYLTADEEQRLRDLYDERETLEIKYKLVEDGSLGYDEIVRSAEAALARGASQESVWADAYAAAAQGQSAYIDSLNAEYDTRYKIIDLMDEGAEKQTAMENLNAWYNEQNAAGIQAYAAALADVAAQTGAFEDNGQYADTTQQLVNAVDALNAGNMEEFASILSGLDETQVVEMAASLAAMQEAGVEMSDGMTTAAESIVALKHAAEEGGDAIKSVEGLQEALNNMFGENLDSEVHELNVTLGTENLSAVYDAWARGEHAPINADIDSENLDASAFTVSGTVSVEGELLTVTTKEGKNYTIDGFKVGVDGELTAVNPKTGEEYKVDGLKVNVDGELVAVNAKTGEEYKVTDVTAGVDGELLKVTAADGMVYKVDGVTAGVDGEIIQISLADDVETPTLEIEATVNKVNFDSGKFSNSGTVTADYNQAGKGVDANEGKKLFAFIPRTSDAEQVHAFAEAIRDYNAAVSALESGDPSVTAQDVEDLRFSLGNLGQDAFNFLDSAGEFGTGFDDMASRIANGLQMMSNGELDTSQIKELMSLITDFETIADSMDADWAAPIAAMLSEAFSSEDLSINWENVDASDLSTVLDEAITAAQEQAAAKMEQAGESAAQGYGEGAANADMSSSASALVNNAYDAVWSAQQSGSPAEMFKPAGESAAQGYGEGAANTDMSSYASELTSSMMNCGCIWKK